MALIHLLKDVAVNLYKGLIYWFFWAGFVTLRDEMFCTVQKRNKVESRYEIVAGGATDAPVATDIVPDIRTLFRKLRAQYEHRAHNAYDAFMAANLANLRLLMEAAKELPQRHLLRISLYSG